MKFIHFVVVDNFIFRAGVIQSQLSRNWKCISDLAL